jgi:hypothetical protein
MNLALNNLVENLTTSLSIKHLLEARSMILCTLDQVVQLAYRCNLPHPIHY